MTTFQTPEPISVAIDLGVGDARIIASARIDTVVQVRPSRISKTSDMEAAEQTRVEFADGRLMVKTPESWKQYTPFSRDGRVDVTVEFDTYGSDFDTVLSAFMGSQASLTEIACDDDTGGTGQSKIKWHASAGVVYRVMLNGYNAATGDFVLHADAEPFFTIDVTVSGRGSIDELTGVPTVRGTVACNIPGYVNNGGIRLHQGEGETRVRATFPAPTFECGPDPGPWELSAGSQTGPFVRGRTRLTDIVWYGVTQDFNESDIQTGESQTVRLRR